MRIFAASKGASRRKERIEREMGRELLSSSLPISLEVRPSSLVLHFPSRVSTPFGFYTFELDPGTPPYQGRPPSRTQPLIRAIALKRKKRIIVLDATCGLGEDAYLLARYGFSVIGVEKNPLLYLLVRDIIARIGIEDISTSTRIRLLCADSLRVLQEIHQGRIDLPLPHVVYLDPMYPSTYRRRGKEKKRMQIIRFIVGGGEDTEAKDLALAAMAIARHKVVIKRPKKHPPLDLGVSPSHSVVGRGHRFDIYYVPKEDK